MEMIASKSISVEWQKPQPKEKVEYTAEELYAYLDMGYDRSPESLLRLFWAGRPATGFEPCGSHNGAKAIATWLTWAQARVRDYDARKLARADRPPPLDLSTLSNMCARKNRYSTLEIAQGVVEAVRARRDVETRPYECPHCGGWHITKQAKREETTT